MMSAKKGKKAMLVDAAGPVKAGKGKKKGGKKKGK